MSSSYEGSVSMLIWYPSRMSECLFACANTHTIHVKENIQLQFI